jgi:hypothetical protein
MEGPLSLPERYLKIVSQLAASGAFGAALLLGAAPPANAAHEPADRQPAAAQEGRVSERLAAIREAVSAVVASEAERRDPIEGLRLAWGTWGNHGWGWHKPWGNWGWAKPWGNYAYRPWGNWRNGGWKNGGWKNWKNWHNR